MTGIIIKTTDAEVVVRIIMLDKRTYVCGYKRTETVGTDEALAFCARDIGKAVEKLIVTGEFPA